jgi:hypothetical protein
MRRILSILIALVLGLAPGLASIPARALTSGFASGWTGKSDDSSLPACCRRNGKHHCALDVAASAPGEISVSAPGSCPFAPHALASTAPSISAIVQDAPGSSLFSAQRLTLSGIATATSASDQHTWPKRGPPSDPIL